MNSIDFFDYRDPWNSTDELYVDILDENLSVDDEIYVAETFYEDGEPFEEFNSARSLNYCKVFVWQSRRYFEGFLKVRCLDNYLIGKEFRWSKEFCRDVSQLSNTHVRFQLSAKNTD